MTEREAYSRVRIGRGVAILIGETHALLDERNGELADRLWTSMSSGGDVDTILEELSATGLRALGDFALAEREDAGIRFVVRGAGRVTITDSGGSVVLDAGETRTWVETVVEDARNFLLQVGGEPVEERLAFRLSSGIVPADAVSWGVPANEGPVEGQDLGWVDDFEPVRPLTVVDVKHAAPSAAAHEDGGEPLEISSGEDPSPGGTGAPDPSTEESGDEFAEGGLIVDSGDTLLPGGLRSDQPTSSAEAAASVAGGEQGDDDDDGLEYDALFGETTFKSVDRAAVDRESESIDESLPQSPAPEPAIVPSTDAVSDVSHPPLSGGLISSVPPGMSPDLRTGQAVASGPGDHDGHTVSLAQLRAMRAQASAQPVQTVAPALGGATVQALICSAGHASPPQAVACRVCGQPISGAPVVIARPTLGRLLVSTGQVIELDRPVVLGRRPKVEGSIPTEVPNMVALGELQGLSRSHAALRLEQWQVLLEDLGSANGTIVTLPGREARRLHEGDPVLLESGALIDLGGEVTLTLELGS